MSIGIIKTNTIYDQFIIVYIVIQTKLIDCCQCILIYQISLDINYRMDEFLTLKRRVHSLDHYINITLSFSLASFRG